MGLRIGQLSHQTARQKVRSIVRRATASSFSKTPKGQGKPDKATTYLSIAGRGRSARGSLWPPSRTVSAVKSFPIRSTSANRRTSSVFEDKDGDGQGRRPAQKAAHRLWRLRPRSRRSRHPHRSGRQARDHASETQGVHGLQSADGKGRKMEEQRHRLPCRHHFGAAISTARTWNRSLTTSAILTSRASIVSAYRVHFR